MNNTNFIYLRALRRADHTVFGVEDGQKRYWDEQFRRYIAYSSGQQVKRSILEEIVTCLGEQPAPTTFYHELDGKKIKEGEAITPGNPALADQLLGGWMIAKAGGANRTIKRRSPLSISALRPIHPLLSNVYNENLSFDRSDRPDLHKVVVRIKGSDKVLSDDEISNLLSGSDRSLRRKWVQGNRRTTGLFVYDIAIDLRTLFAISTNQLEPELSPETIEALENDGWERGENVFGECLIAPEPRRKEIIKELAGALINWRITTNQSRTFSPMETLAVAISHDANKVAGAIRAKLIEEGDTQKAKPVVDDSLDDTFVYVTLAGGGYFSTNVESAKAMESAKAKLKELMSGFDYKNQTTVPAS